MKETYFECPECKAFITAPNDRRGQKEPCPGCGGIVTIPFKSLKKPQTTFGYAVKVTLIMLAIAGAIAAKGWWDGKERESKREQERSERLSKQLLDRQK